jgi:hypothetical protein
LLMGIRSVERNTQTIFSVTWRQRVRCLLWRGCRDDSIARFILNAWVNSVLLTEFQSPTLTSVHPLLVASFLCGSYATLVWFFHLTKG